MQSLSNNYFFLESESFSYSTWREYSLKYRRTISWSITKISFRSCGTKTKRICKFIFIIEMNKEDFYLIFRLNQQLNVYIMVIMFDVQLKKVHFIMLLNHHHGRISWIWKKEMFILLPKKKRFFFLIHYIQPNLFFLLLERSL